MTAFEVESAQTLDELSVRLTVRGIATSTSALKKRRDWFEAKPDLDPERPVFIDGTEIRFLPPCSPEFNPVEMAS